VIVPSSTFSRVLEPEEQASEVIADAESGVEYLVQVSLADTAGEPWPAGRDTPA
jgi:hypothetical protein